MSSDNLEESKESSNRNLTHDYSHGVPARLQKRINFVLPTSRLEAGEQIRTLEVEIGLLRGALDAKVPDNFPTNDHYESWFSSAKYSLSLLIARKTMVENWIHAQKLAFKRAVKKPINKEAPRSTTSSRVRIALPPFRFNVPDGIDEAEARLAEIKIKNSAAQAQLASIPKTLESGELRSSLITEAKSYEPEIRALTTWLKTARKKEAADLIARRAALDSNAPIGLCYRAFILVARVCKAHGIILEGENQATMDDLRTCLIANGLMT